MTVRTTRSGARVTLVVAIALALAVAIPAYAQSNTVKQGDALKKTAAAAKDSLQKVLDDFRSSLSLYNEVLGGDAKKRQANYKKLTSELKSSEKNVQAAQKNADSLRKQSDKFFQSWEKDLQDISSDDMKQKSEARLNATKEQFAAVGQMVKQATDELKPLADSFNDQVLFLGRDLSDDAVADLQDEAEKLNAQAEQVLGKVESILSSTGEAQMPADDQTAGDTDADADSDADAPDEEAEGESGE